MSECALIRYNLYYLSPMLDYKGLNSVAHIEPALEYASRLLSILSPPVNFGSVLIAHSTLIPGAVSGYTSTGKMRSDSIVLVSATMSGTSMI